MVPLSYFLLSATFLTSFEATRKTSENNVTFNENIISSANETKGKNVITENPQQNLTVERKFNNQEEDTRVINIIPIIQKRLNNDAIIKSLDSFSMLRKKTNLPLTNTGETVYSLNQNNYLIRESEIGKEEKLMPVKEFQTIQRTYQPVENDAVKRSLDKFTINKNVELIDFSNLQTPVNFERIRFNNNDYQGEMKEYKNLENVISNNIQKQRHYERTLYNNNMDNNQRLNKKEYFVNEHQGMEPDSDFVTAIKKQTELMENFLSALNILKQGDSLREKKYNANSDFDELMKQLQAQKVQLSGKLGKFASKLAVEGPVETMVDETEVRKALLEDPYVRRILKLNKQNRDRYYKNRKPYEIKNIIN